MSRWPSVGVCPPKTTELMRILPPSSGSEIQTSSSKSVLGSTLYLNYRPFTIVGVAAPSFLGSTGDNRPDVWIPIPPFRDRYVSWAAMAENRDIPLVRVFGRLRDGVRNDQAQSELMAVATGLDEVYPGRDQARQVHFEGA